MGDDEAGLATTAPSTPSPAAGRGRWLKPRAILRALHRDIGYLLVGLTFIYALSGLAINHVGDGDWDPNFERFERIHQLGGPLPREDGAAARAVRAALSIDATPRDLFRVSDRELEIGFADRTLFVDLDTGVVREEGQTPRFFLRVANWLHYNRGKRAWTYVADGYAVLLLLLAVSGLFMIKGSRGLRGRGVVLLLLGAAVPAAYVWLSGGPDAARGPPGASPPPGPTSTM